MKKRIISLLMVALLAACMVPLMAAPAFAASSPEGIVFGYAYDGQRSPSFPVAGETVTYSSITEPISTNGSDHDSTSDGSWCLTNVGTYGYVKSIGKGSANLESIVNTVVDKYKDAGKTLDKNNIVIHELKNGSTHYAYGLTVAYDPTQEIVLFIGDNRGSGGIGYILSKNEITVKSVTAVASLAIGDWTPPPTYGIAVNTVENGTVTSPVAAALAGDTIKLTVSPAAGYKLSSLTVTAADNSSVPVSGDNSFTMPAQAVTVSASFSLKSYTVTYKADGVPVGEPVTVEHGKDVPAEKIPAIPAKTGYDQTDPTWDDEGKNITADTTINAVYTINKYAVTYVADGRTVDTVTVEHGQDVPAEKIPAIPAKTGYDQTAPTWEADGTNITADTTINALYTINTYEVKYMADGEPVGEPVTVEHGQDVPAEKIPAIPAKTGYDKTAPTWDDEGKNITADTTITALYTINTYEVKYMADGVQVGQTQTVEHGKDAVPETVPAKTGYDQTAPTWDGDGKNITADTTINALYTINTYEVKYMADGVQVGQTQTVEHGKDAVPEAVPAKEGYMGKWGSDGKNITGDTTIEAVYTLIPVETPSEIPATGDNSHVLLWGAVLVLTMTAAALIIGKKKYNT